MLRRLSPLLALVLVFAACGDDAGTTTAPSTTLDALGFEQAIDDLVTVTEQLRGLDFVEDPAVAIVDQEELARRVRDQVSEDLDPSEVAVYQRLYEILGLLDGTIDLQAAYEDLYAEQVGGFYDNDTKELVISGADTLSPLAESIVVHELVHALTDQHYGFAGELDDLFDQERFEEAAAIQALAEGDALYFQLVYLETLPVDERVEAIQESLDADTTVLDALPDWFGEDLTFPYDYGFALVDHLVDEGDIAAINRAYERLPDTTEQILHPEKYSLSEPGREVTLADFDLPGYAVFADAVFGEWNTQLYLLDGVEPGEAVIAASGWGGDRYRVYSDEGAACDGQEECLPAVALVVLFESDTPRDAEELAGSLALSAHNIMRVGVAQTNGDGVTTYSGGPDFAYVAVSGSQVLFIAADDPTVGSQLVDAFALAAA
jgi:hypothetical protein